MTLMEAKALAGAETVIRIFEESYRCKIPEYLKEETQKEWVDRMRPLEEWIRNV